MAPTTDARHGPNGNDKRDDRRMVRSVLIAGGLFTAAWLVGLILIARWAIVTVF